MRRIIPLGATALPFLALFANHAYAQETDTVIVTATRSSTALANIPESVSVVTDKDIQATPAKSLDEILRSVPSVNLPTMASYQIHPNLDTIAMRGLGGNRALVLLDGVPLNDPFFGFVQWSLIPLANIDRVEVVRGGGAALWGNYAMGGVIDVITRTPKEQEFALDAAGGSYGTVRVDGYAAVPLSDHVRFSVDAATLRTDGYDPVSAAYRVPLTVPSYFRANNVQTALDFDLDPSLSGTLRAGYHDTASTLHTPVNQNGQREWTASGNLAKRLGSSTLTATVFHTYTRLFSANSDTPTGGVAGTVEYVQNYHQTPATADGGSLVWSLSGKEWLRLLSIGGDYQELHGSDKGYIFNSAGTLLRTDPAHGGQRFAGAFVQADLVPLKDLHLLGSARYQYFQNFDGYDGAPGGAGHVPDTSKSSFDPRLSVRYDLTPVFSLRAAGYEAFRAPVMNNLYRSFSNRFGIFSSNATLKPETLTGFEAGFDVNLPTLRAQVTFYHNIIDDLLTTRKLAHAELPAGFNFGTLNINAGSARAQGVEAQINWRITSQLAATFGYAYADSTITANTADPVSVGKQLGGVPRQSGSVQLAYTAGAGWKLSSTLYWHDKLYSDNDQTLPIESQVVVGLGASWPVSKHFEPYVQIQNLFNERNVADNPGTSAPQLETPFTAMVGLRARF